MFVTVHIYTPKLICWFDKEMYFGDSLCQVYIDFFKMVYTEAQDTQIAKR